MKLDDTKAVFGTPEWFGIVQRVFSDLVATRGEPEGRFSMCEVWTTAPESSVGSQGGGRAGFHLRVAGTTSEIVPGEVDDVDVKFVLAYTTAARLARVRFPDGSESAPQGDTETSTAVVAEDPPAMEVHGDPSLMPPYMLEFHNRLVLHTA